MIVPRACGLRRHLCALTLVALLHSACSPDSEPPAATPIDVTTVHVFTTIAEPRLAQVLEELADQLGVNVVVFHDADKAPPDLFIGGSIAELTSAAEENTFRPTRSPTITERIPEQLRDPDHYWAALGVRVRTVAYHPALASGGDVESIVDFASLAGERWRDRLCLSSSSFAGNRSLIARLIRDNGEREAEKILRGWRSNLAQPVFADDQKLLQAIMAGTCVIGIVDTSEVERYSRVSSTGLPGQHRFADVDRWHIELSGAGVTRHASNPEIAAELLELLTGDEANALFAATVLEYPANPEATVHEAIHERTRIARNSVKASELGFFIEDAQKLAQRARYP